MRRLAPHGRRQRGLSLVELLIGSALGLLLVGCGITVLLIQLRESRFNIEQRRVEQDHKLLAARMRQLALTGQLLPALGLPGLPSEVSDPS